ncbi:M16 family metallopeptidase [Poseidonocella sedimentorum]|uniref:Zinc protease n=1 Tax=Poseidonocella sedimentorum TaxID=871652 RepID=A0A1I6E8V2_9RHOB|nr:pitrilysin family protein [Poseidonocella sedimentorum]SFR14150.1 zinc protease [Poseidonocella sedimentorum]
MRTHRFFAALLLALGLIQLPPAARGSDLVTSFTLDNGMEVVVIEDHRAPVVVHMVWYRAGAADEPAGASGVAHFLEHLLFKGTDNMAPGELSRVVAENGGTDNAFTSQDYTAYFQRVAADRLGLMMQMEADRMVNLRLGPEDIATERDVIIEERNQRTENSPGGLFAEQRDAALYLHHPYGTPVIGWRHEMEALSLEDALAYYSRYYAPNNAILIVAGDATPEEVRALAQTHYGPIPPNPELSPRARVAEPPHMAERRLIFRDDRVAQPYVMRSYLAPERDPGDQTEAAALTLLAELLGGDGITSYMARKLQFETQTAVYTAAFYRGTSLDDTSFGFIVVPAEGVSLDAAEEALERVMADFLTEGVDAEALARLKRQIHASTIYERDNVQSLANSYGRGLTSGLTLEDIQAWPDILQAVTAEDILAAARRLWTPERSVTGHITNAEDPAL